MYKIGATVSKEILLLSRDRSGLLLLFLMPALLVLVMTLVQENVLKTMGESRTRVIFVDKDRQEVGQGIERKLAGMPAIEIIKEIDGREIDEKTALARVMKGDFQLCIVIPRGASSALKADARQTVKGALEGKAVPKRTAAGALDIRVYFDPTVFGGTRSAILQSLELLIFGIEMDEKISALSDLLPEYIPASVKEAIGPLVPEGMGIDIPGMRLDVIRTRLLGVRESPAGDDVLQKKPTSVQQNVPAWALFGIFFVVIPMAGGLISERKDETLARLRIMPVSYFSIMAGKIVAYVCVCLIQFGLMLFIGKHILPLLGAPALEMGSDATAVLIVALSAILAATGYGIMLGTLAKTYEQASMVGPISIVIAAALGGIMVPVYAMPKIMRDISVYSPLAWGHDAFLNVFVRGGGLKSVVWQVMALLSFFAATVLVSRVCFSLRGRNGG
jgi:ABC-2 type transport system permease protein